jgi:hypothetical protein
MSDDLSPAQRLLAVLDHLGLGRAHVATQLPGDVAELAAANPDRFDGIMHRAGLGGLVCFPSARGTALASPRGLCAVLAHGGGTADLARRPRQGGGGPRVDDLLALSLRGGDEALVASESWEFRWSQTRPELCLSRLTSIGHNALS